MPSFAELKEELLAREERVLYEDPDFPARPESISKIYTIPSDSLWKRPRDIIVNPKFIIEGATRFDMAQGSLGNCWFIAGCAVLATKPDLFAQVVPNDQDFVKQYVGMFRFNIWRFGEWVEVIVDDRLPVDIDGQLKYCYNKGEPNEFWGPLLEKAYAKLHGSYESIASGFIRDALVDFTGGLSESYMLNKPERLPPDLFEIVHTAFKQGAMLGGSIKGDTDALGEEEMYNGLYSGHAYSITHVIEERIQGWQVHLVRLRNPWGHGEWKGKWSDGSEEWKSVSEEDKNRIGLVFNDEGEFWMNFEDFVKNFTLLEVVHLGPQTFSRIETPEGNVKWNETMHHGEWIKGITAGGSGLFSATANLYNTNPKYFMTITNADEGDIIDECTCIISLMQIDYRIRRMTPGAKRYFVGFDVHQFEDELRSSNPETIALSDSDTFFDNTKLKKKFDTKTALREVSSRIQLGPGTYCVIPNTLKAGQEAEFLLRIFTYSKVESKEIKEETKPIPDDAQPVEKPLGSVSSELFYQYSGEDHVIDARDLRDFLQELTKAEFGETTTFSVEACRTLIAMVDHDTKGTLDFDQIVNLWDEILFWKQVFKTYDKDGSGCIETYELRSLFRKIGFTLSQDVLVRLAVRYGGKDRTIFFEDFVLCLAKTMTMFAAFRNYSKDTPGTASLTLEEWMKTTLSY